MTWIIQYYNERRAEWFQWNAVKLSEYDAKHGVYRLASKLPAKTFRAINVG